MKFSSLKSLFSNTAKERDVFYFSTDKIKSEEPHYFICIKKTDNDVLIFSCGTTQWEKRMKYIEAKGMSLATLVYINPKKMQESKKRVGVCFS